MHRDAARSPGGAEEPQEPELPRGDPSALPSVGIVPHGESAPAFLRVHFCISHPSRVLTFQDSLAAEIEGTMRKELSLDDLECKEQK